MLPGLSRRSPSHPRAPLHADAGCVVRAYSFIQWTATGGADVAGRALSGGILGAFKAVELGRSHSPFLRLLIRSCKCSSFRGACAVPTTTTFAVVSSPSPPGPNAFASLGITSTTLMGFDGLPGSLVRLTATASSGTLRLASASATAGLTSCIGYPASDWLSGTAAVLAFEGTQQAIATALHALEYRAIAMRVKLTVTPAGMAYLPSTGHYYELDVSQSLNYTQARCRALYVYSAGSPSPGADCAAPIGVARSLRSFNGIAGYLATVTRATENALVAALAASATSMAYLGGSSEEQGVCGSFSCGTEGRREGSAVGNSNMATPAHTPVCAQIFHWTEGPEVGTTFWRSPDCTPGLQGVCPATGEFNWWAVAKPSQASGSALAIQPPDTSSVSFWNDVPPSTPLPAVIEYGGIGGEALLEASTEIVVGMGRFVEVVLMSSSPLDDGATFVTADAGDVIRLSFNASEPLVMGDPSACPVVMLLLAGTGSDAGSWARTMFVEGGPVSWVAIYTADASIDCAVAAFRVSGGRAMSGIAFDDRPLSTATQGPSLVELGPSPPLA